MLKMFNFLPTHQASFLIILLINFEIRLKPMLYILLNTNFSL